jgi:hypothetical protein
MNELDGLLTAQGLTSRVYDNNESVLGHILLMDYDSGYTNDQFKSEIESLKGFTFIFESSPGSKHVINTTVRKADSMALQMLTTHCDPKHIQIGYRRHDGPYWVLRVGPKTHSNNQNPEGQEYKDSPELKDLLFPSGNVTPQSRPHLDFLFELTGVEKPEFYEEIPFVGVECETSTYTTLVDELKA